MDWLVAILFVVTILVVVMVHESGHFFTAKAFGIKVQEFFVGFGPRLWSFRRGETEYGIKALPFGGYVRIAGMNPYEEIDPADRPRLFGSKPIWQRALVIGAGPVTHFVMAVLLLGVYFVAVGVPSAERPLISAIQPRVVQVAAPPSGPGVQAGDFILDVAGRSLGTFDSEEAFISYVEGLGTDPVALTVERGDERLRLQVQATLSVVGSPAAGAGLQTGDEIVRLDGEPVGSVDGFINYTRAHLGAPIEVTVVRDGQERTQAATPVLSTAGGEVAARLGVSLDGVRERTGPLTALGRGFIQTGLVAKGVVQQMGNVFGPAGVKRIGQLLFGGGQRSSNDVVSVVGAARLATQAAQAGAWDQLFELLIVLNVFVGILNLIPLPPFDGGHLAVLAVEKVSRRTVDPRKLVPLTAVVAGYLILFSLTVVILDIFKPLPNPFP